MAVLSRVLSRNYEAFPIDKHHPVLARDYFITITIQAEFRSVFSMLDHQPMIISWFLRSEFYTMVPTPLLSHLAVCCETLFATTVLLEIHVFFEGSFNIFQPQPPIAPPMCRAPMG